MLHKSQGARFKRRSFAWLGLLLAVVLVAAACGSDSELSADAAAEVIEESVAAPSQEATAAPTEEPTEAPTEEPTEAPTEEPAEEFAAASPAEVIEVFRVAYNTGDMDSLEALFTEESVIIDHPSALFQGFGSDGKSLAGLQEIRAGNEWDRQNAAPAEAYEFVNVEVDGDTVTWDHAWEGANLAEWCGEGHSATVIDGKVITWSYSPETHPCAADCAFEDVFTEGDMPDRCRRQA